MLECGQALVNVAFSALESKNTNSDAMLSESICDADGNIFLKLSDLRNGQQNALNLEADEIPTPILAAPGGENAFCCRKLDFTTQLFEHTHIMQCRMPGAYQNFLWSCDLPNSPRLLASKTVNKTCKKTEIRSSSCLASTCLFRATSFRTATIAPKWFETVFTLLCCSWSWRQPMPTAFWTAWTQML